MATVPDTKTKVGLKYGSPKPVERCRCTSQRITSAEDADVLLDAEAATAATVEVVSSDCVAAVLVVVSSVATVAEVVVVLVGFCDAAADDDDEMVVASSAAAADCTDNTTHARSNARPTCGTMIFQVLKYRLLFIAFFERTRNSSGRRQNQVRCIRRLKLLTVTLRGT